MKSKRSWNLFINYWALSVLLVVIATMPVVFCTIASANDIVSARQAISVCNLSSLSDNELDVFPRGEISNGSIPNSLWDQAQTAVQNRYRRNDILGFVKQIDREKSLDLLLQLWQLVTYYYYHDIDQAKLAERAFVELQVAVKSDAIREKYKLRDAENEILLERINDILISVKSKSDIDYSWLKKQLTNLSNSCEKTGLDSSWPILEFIFSICDNLDIYSNYLLPERYFEMLDALKGNYSGVGIDIVFRKNNFPLVFDVVDDSPAAKAGIKPGDLLIKLDDFSLKCVDEQQYDSFFLDEEKDRFTITVQRETDSLKFDLTKEYVKASSVRNVRTFFDATTGYIRISNFGRKTAIQTELALKQLIDQGVESVIIDLRNNGGGMVTSAIDTSDLFLKEGEIVSIKSYSGIKTYIASADNKQTEDVSIVLLVNNDTASAAEIFTAALKQNNRAIVVGNKTFGKAVVQTVYDLEYNAGAIVLTTAEYFPPSGISFNQKGIIPNIEVVNTENAEFHDTDQCITDRISEENIVMSTALKCLKN